MPKKDNIVEDTANDLMASRRQGESLTDLRAVLAKTEAELEADIASDADFRDEPKDWYLNAIPVPASAKTPLSIRLDADIVAWFRLQRPCYQTRINAVLRSYVQHAAKTQA